MALAEQHEVALEAVRAAGEGGEVGIDRGGERGRAPAPAAKDSLELGRSSRCSNSARARTRRMLSRLSSPVGGEQRLREGDDGKAAVEAADEVLECEIVDADAGEDPPRVKRRGSATAAG